MDYLAYLHCASAYDEAPSIESTPAEDAQPLFNGLNWKKLSGKVCLALLPVAIVLGIVVIPEQAQARGCYTYSYRPCKVRHRVIRKPKYYVKHYPVVIRRPVYRYKYYPVYKHYPVVIRRPKFVHVTYPVVVPRPRYFYKDVPVVITRPKCYKHKVVHRPACFDDWDGGCGQSFAPIGFQPAPAIDYDDDEFAVYKGGCGSGSCSS